MNMMKYLEKGRKMIEVTISLTGNNVAMDPTGFKTSYEEYKLSVESNGKVKIEASYYPGIVRGLDSFSQLIEKNEETKTDFRIKYAPINISDKPNFAYRGIMLDTSREYYYPEAIKQMLDGMMIARLNVFHWHFVDSDSMPMQLKSYPDMTNYTAFRKTEIYTPEMVDEIVSYARVRGIKVIPEIEGPANVNSIGHYPDLNDIVECYKGKTGYRSGPPPPAALNPQKNKTYEFLENFMKDIRDSFNPQVMHLGGDKVDKKCCKNFYHLLLVPLFVITFKIILILHFYHFYLGKDVRDFKEEFSNYIQKERKILNSIDRNITAMYWYDNDRLDYSPTDILQYKGNSRQISAEMSTEPHNMFVLSPSDTMIVDCGFPDYTGGRSRCYSTKSWKDYWIYDPEKYNTNGKVLGSEILAWSHMSNEFDFLTKIFPRSAVMSFKHWNSKGASGGGLIELLMRFQYRVKAYGVPTEKISMRY